MKIETDLSALPFFIWMLLLGVNFLFIWACVYVWLGVLIHMHTNTFYLNAKHINPLNGLKIKNLMSILETKNRSNSILTTVYIHIQNISFFTHVTIVCHQNDWIYHWILNLVFILWHMVLFVTMESMSDKKYFIISTLSVKYAILKLMLMMVVGEFEIPF